VIYLLVCETERIVSLFEDEYVDEYASSNIAVGKADKARTEQR